MDISNKNKTPEWRCLSIQELEGWRKDNDYILKGYRPQMKATKSLESVLRFHNETGAIWTHLIAALLFANLTVYTYVCNPRNYGNPEMCLIMVYLGTSVLCFSISAAFHTFQCLSMSVSRLLCKLDYIGITIFIFGSFIPWLYYGFQDNFEVGKRYMALVAALAVLCVIISCIDNFTIPHNRHIRAAVFLAYGLIAVLPATHFRLQFCHGVQALCDSFKHLCIMGTIQSIAALIYATRIPERVFPGCCDYWFNSHQIFHSLVVVGSMVHYHCLLRLIQFRLSENSERIFTYFPFNYFNNKS